MVNSKFLFNYFKNAALKIERQSQKKWYSRYQKKYAIKYPFNEIISNYPDPNELYAYMHHYHHHFCPKEIQKHRKFFDMNQRGFGEDAFHAMWWLLFQEYKPHNCLEIGVYRGQTISLWSLIAKMLNFSSSIVGISPMTSIGDTVSCYPEEINYEEDIINNFDHFKLKHPKLIQAYSTDERAIKEIETTKWDLIYIDGSHDFDIALQDYLHCKENLSKPGLLIFDDSSLGSNYKPLKFSFAGHPGPSRICNEYAMREMKFLGGIGHINIFQRKG